MKSRMVTRVFAYEHCNYLVNVFELVTYHCISVELKLTVRVDSVLAFAHFVSAVLQQLEF